jgi:hypothetical protein
MRGIVGEERRGKETDGCPLIVYAFRIQCLTFIYNYLCPVPSLLFVYFMYTYVSNPKYNSLASYD